MDGPRGSLAASLTTIAINLRRSPPCERRTEVRGGAWAFCGLLSGGRRAAQVRRPGSEERSWAKLRQLFSQR